MRFFPEYFEEVADNYDWSRGKRITYIASVYLVTTLYLMLVILAVRNIWAVLIRQKKYKNLPILAFYFFTMIAVTLRPIYMIGFWT